MLCGLIGVSQVGNSGWRGLINPIESDNSARNWLGKNTKAGDTIRMEDAFTGDYVKSLILIAPTSAIITSRRNVGTIEFSY